MELWLGLVVGMDVGVDGGSCGGVVVMDYTYSSLRLYEYQNQQRMQKNITLKRFRSLHMQSHVA